MALIKYDSEIMKIMSLFEALTGARLKDAINAESIMFIVQENEIGKAIGKHGANAKRLERLFKRKIRIVEFNNDILQFAKNLAYPINLRNTSFSDKVLTLECNDNKSIGILIGRNKRNLNFITNVMKRYFNVEEIKVL